MAFTTSHPAAVLIFNYLPRRWFSLTALVIGSMIPDFEYFIRMKMETRYSHTFWGMFWFDLPLSFVFLLIYNTLIKDKLTDRLPEYLNRRFSAFKNLGRPWFKRPLGVIALSVLIGTASHLFWDSFTHPGRFFVRHIHWLTHTLTVAGHRILVYNLVQHISTLIGALVIVYAIMQLPVGKCTKTGRAVMYWVEVLIVAALFLTIMLLTGISARHFADIIVTFFSGIWVALIVVSVLTPAKNNAG